MFIVVFLKLKIGINRNVLLFMQPDFDKNITT
jgi:hypothetical protein